MKPSRFLIMMMLFCACKKAGLHFPEQEDPRTRKQVTGTVVINTCNCTNPWSGAYPTIVQLDMPIGQQLFVFTANLADSFRIPGGKIKFDLEFARNSRTNWCNGIRLPEEAQLSNVQFD